jgi:hypothetical protein
MTNSAGTMRAASAWPKRQMSGPRNKASASSARQRQRASQRAPTDSGWFDRELSAACRKAENLHRQLTTPNASITLGSAIEKVKALKRTVTKLSAVRARSDKLHALGKQVQLLDYLICQRRAAVSSGTNATPVTTTTVSRNASRAAAPGSASVRHAAPALKLLPDGPASDRYYMDPTSSK